jgi:phosphoserine phosphatase RsbU/P
VPFREWDEFLLGALSAQCGMAIHRHALMEEFAEHKRMQQELAIAQGIQRSLFPALMPIIEGYDVAGWSQTAEEKPVPIFSIFTYLMTSI